MLVTQISKCFN